MNLIEAKHILENFKERIDLGDDGKYRLPGIVTSKEVSAIDFVLGCLLATGTENSGGGDSAQLAGKTKIAELRGPNASTDESRLQEPTTAVGTETATVLMPEEAASPTARQIRLDLSALELTAPPTDVRVCLDFGTAMSKATLVYDADEGYDEIRVLKLGVPGNQEEIDISMLVSSVFIDSDGKLWFGREAADRAHLEEEGSGHMRLDNIKRWLSEGNMNTKVDKLYNPTSIAINYSHLVLAYLTFFTWAVNVAVEMEEVGTDVPRNVLRRFAMPCLAPAEAREVSATLSRLLGEAQILADTFHSEIATGVSLADFVAALDQLRGENRAYSFVEASITEPLGVAGSLLSWKQSVDALTMVVDIGAGTSDFSLYRLAVNASEGAGHSGSGRAMEVEGSSRGITEAGNHLDKILKGVILARAGIASDHPSFSNVSYDIERDIRETKEELFNTGSVLVTLRTGDSVDITLEDFTALDAVQMFRASLRKTMEGILSTVDVEFLSWVRASPHRNLVVVLTGGGANLPMVRELAIGPINVNGASLQVVAARAFPKWLEDDYADLADIYPRVAVSLGGARKHLIESKGQARTTASDGTGVRTLDRFASQGA